MILAILEITRSYVSIDSAAITSVQLSDEDILANVREMKSTAMEENDLCEVIEAEAMRIPKGKEARAAIDVLRRYISGSDKSASLLDSVNAIEDFESESQHRQSKITNFFCSSTCSY